MARMHFRDVNIDAPLSFLSGRNEVDVRTRASIFHRHLRLVRGNEMWLLGALGCAGLEMGDFSGVLWPVLGVCELTAQREPDTPRSVAQPLGRVRRQATIHETRLAEQRPGALMSQPGGLEGMAVFFSGIRILKKIK